MRRAGVYSRRFKPIFIHFIRVVIIAPACAPHSPQDCLAVRGHISYRKYGFRCRGSYYTSSTASGVRHCPQGNLLRQRVVDFVNYGSSLYSELQGGCGRWRFLSILYYLLFLIYYLQNILPCKFMDFFHLIRCGSIIHITGMRRL